MKKFVAMVLALVLALGACMAVVAEDENWSEATTIILNKDAAEMKAGSVTASKVVEDLMNVETVENLNMTLEGGQGEAGLLYIETKKLIEMNDVEAYFAVEKGTTIADVLGEGEYVVNEMCYANLTGNAKVEEDVGLLLNFPTVFEEGEEVVVMVGIVTIVDGEEVVEWHLFRGIGVNGGVYTVLDKDMIEKMQNKKSLIAVVQRAVVAE